MYVITAHETIRIPDIAADTDIHTIEDCEMPHNCGIMHGMQTYDST